MRLYGEITPELGDYRLYRRTNNALSHSYHIIYSVDLTHYGVFRAKDGVFVDSSTNTEYFFFLF